MMLRKEKEVDTNFEKNKMHQLGPLKKEENQEGFIIPFPC